MKSSLRHSIHGFPSLFTGLFFLVVLFSASSCTKEIEVVLPDAENKIVVEGWIENDQYPVVKLSRSAGFFDPVPTLADTIGFLNYILNDLVVQNATVIVSDGIISDTLVPTLDIINFSKEYRLPLVYLGHTIKGEVGKTYTLKVMVEGKTLTSSTRIPELIYMDTLYWKPDISDDGVGFPWTKFQDPDTLGNAYRIFTRRGGYDEPYVAPIGNEFDDYFVNGTAFDFPFNRGSQLSDDTLQNDAEDRIRGKYLKGDTMDIKFCTMDKASYDFWRTFSISRQSNGSPFAAPINLKSNISGKGGIGIWSGYGATFKKAVAQ
ncbi:MAG: DUF4249 domain-containing protein [Bacteroidia bacterium]|nr:DUF4249 domain-containing protein [Bacteroidia bacterium]